MSTRSLLLLGSLLALSACGKAKTGEGYSSGVCKEDVVEDYAEMSSKCSEQMRARSKKGYENCKEEAEDFLKEYPDVSCEISGQNYGTQYGGQYNGQYGYGRIEHTMVKNSITMLEQAINRFEQASR